MSGLDRRDFIKLSTLLSMGMVTPAWAQNLARKEHFLIIFDLPGGLDQAHFFDARPLEMTKNGLQVNHHPEEPAFYRGSNGQSLLMHPACQVLKPLLPDLCIVNGIHMSSQFDGHSENQNQLYTGGEFGGEGFFKAIGEQFSGNLVLATSSKRTLDFKITGAKELTFLEARHLQKLKTLVGNNKSDEWQVLQKNLYRKQLAMALKNGQGLFKNSLKGLEQGFEGSLEFENKLLNIDLNIQEGEDPFLSDLKFYLSLFKHGMTNVALFNGTQAVDANALFMDLDTHGGASAQETPKMVEVISKRISNLIKTLKSVEYKNGESFFERTTLLICSEFGRTMRQQNQDVGVCGTDHNPYTNSMILAGRGIRGGTVFGATDFQSSQEVLSQKHLKLDPQKLKVMGRPFDFETMKPHLNEGHRYELTSHSLVNTLFHLFNVPQKSWRKLSGGRKAPILQGALKGA